MKKRLIGVTLAAVLAVIGTFAVLAYVRDADDRARSDVELVEVFVIEGRVDAGTDEAGMRRAIGTELIPATNVVDGVVTTLTQLDGRVAAVDLVAGEQLLISRLVDEAAFDDGRSHLTSVPVGKHEVTISLDPERVIGGQIVPGDTVAVIGSFDPFSLGAVDIDNLDEEEIAQILLGDVGDDRDDGDENALDGENSDVVNAEPPTGLKTGNTTHVMLNKILVTRIQLEQLPRERTDANGEPIDDGVLAPTGNLLVTFALDPHEVEQLIFTAEFGRIWLSYEPIDASEDELEVVTRVNVYGHLHEDPDAADSVVEPISDTTEAEEVAS